MGAVYLAADRRLGNKWVAIKEMSDAAITDPLQKQQAIAAFHQEAQLLAHLDHQNIPKIMDFFTENSHHYMVMEFVQGETLEAFLQQRAGVCDEQQVRDWALQLCDVLSYLHQQTSPVIFRDLKPGNIMLTPAGQPKLIDFGIARFFKAGRPGDTLIMGTPGYAPPEQYGHSQTDARSDIYSLGVLLHHLLTLHDPALTPFALPPVQQLNPTVSAQMARIISRSVGLRPGDRYQSVTELRQDLVATAVSSQAPTISLTPRRIRVWGGIAVV
ncbi:MAG: serine/threonine-protein kinase, partial [Anaerolineae bacterium]